MLEYCGQDPYTGLARKLGLIDRNVRYGDEGHPQVIDYGHIHHKLHASLCVLSFWI